MPRAWRILLRPAMVVGAGLFLLATGVITLPNPLTDQADRFWNALYIHGAQVEDHEDVACVGRSR